MDETENYGHLCKERAGIQRTQAFGKGDTKCYWRKGEAALSMVEVMLEVGMYPNKMAWCQKDRKGSYRSDPFEQKYEGMKGDDICDNKGSSPV